MMCFLFNPVCLAWLWQYTAVDLCTLMDFTDIIKYCCKCITAVSTYPWEKGMIILCTSIIIYVINVPLSSATTAVQPLSLPGSSDIEMSSSPSSSLESPSTSSSSSSSPSPMNHKVTFFTSHPCLEAMPVSIKDLNWNNGSRNDYENLYTGIRKP